MSKLTIAVPSPSSPAYPGASGAVHLVFEPSFLAIAGKASASIRDAAGTEVWGNSATVTNNEAWISLQWPAVPGTYSISASAFGSVMGNILATATQQFTVAAPKLGEAPG